MKQATALTLHTRRTPAEEWSAAVDGFLYARRTMNCSWHTLDYYSHRLAAFTRYLTAHGGCWLPGMGYLPNLIGELLRDEVVKVNPLEHVERVRRGD